MNTLNILGLCGSLRQASLNHGALRLAGSVMPASMKLDIADWRAVPIFDGDLLAQGMPPAVAQLGEQIRQADAVLIATPEYNFSVPGGQWRHWNLGSRARRACVRRANQAPNDTKRCRCAAAR